MQGEVQEAAAAARAAVCVRGQACSCVIAFVSWSRKSSRFWLLGSSCSICSMRSRCAVHDCSDDSRLTAVESSSAGTWRQEGRKTPAGPAAALVLAALRVLGTTPLLRGSDVRAGPQPCRPPRRLLRAPLPFGRWRTHSCYLAATMPGGRAGTAPPSIPAGPTPAECTSRPSLPRRCFAAGSPPSPASPSAAPGAPEGLQSAAATGTEAAPEVTGCPALGCPPASVGATPAAEVAGGGPLRAASRTSARQRSEGLIFHASVGVGVSRDKWGVTAELGRCLGLGGLCRRPGHPKGALARARLPGS